MYSANGIGLCIRLSNKQKKAHEALFVYAWWTYGESDPDLIHAMDA